MARSYREIKESLQKNLASVIPSPIGTAADALLTAVACEIEYVELKLDKTWNEEWDKINAKRIEAGLPTMTRPDAPWKINE